MHACALVIHSAYVQTLDTTDPNIVRRDGTSLLNFYSRQRQDVHSALAAAGATTGLAIACGAFAALVVAAFVQQGKTPMRARYGGYTALAENDAIVLAPI